MTDVGRPYAQWPDDADSASTAPQLWSLEYDPLTLTVTLSDSRPRVHPGLVVTSETATEKKVALTEDVNGREELTVAYQNGTVTIF